VLALPVVDECFMDLRLQYDPAAPLDADGLGARLLSGG